MRRLIFLPVALAMLCGVGSGASAGFATGRLELKSAGAMAFGPNGILLIGDSLGAMVAAVETGDTQPSASAGPVEITGLDGKIASALGTSKDEILIHDIKVNPISKKIYISVSRGRGPAPMPFVLRVDGSGKVEEVSLANISFASVGLPNPPVSNPRAGNRDSRLETITQLAWVENEGKGLVIVAGLSNEEFSSNLRIIPFPFHGADAGASVEIFHGSHGDYETQAPVRTFVPYRIGGKPFIVAAYTCTPLVTIPLSQLKPGAKVTGTTIAELGMGNRPLDMIAYRKDGHDYFLMANSSRGVMRLPAENLERYAPITEQVQQEGVPYHLVRGLSDVRHLTTLDSEHALILTQSNLTKSNGSMDLRSIPLP